MILSVSYKPTTPIARRPVSLQLAPTKRFFQNWGLLYTNILETNYRHFMRTSNFRKLKAFYKAGEFLHQYKDIGKFAFRETGSHVRDGHCRLS